MKRQVLTVTLLFILLYAFSSLNVCLAFTYSLQGFRLAVYIAPPVIPADGGSYDCIYVQIQDENGEPLTLTSNLTVILTSSNLEVGTVNERLLIPAGESFSTSRFNATFQPGFTTITASAQGFMPGTATLRTVNPYSEALTPLKLRVYVSPGIIPAMKGLKGKILVQLLDSNETPLVASSNINVTLTSSNTTVLTIPSPITIRKGFSYGVSSYTITGHVGEAAVTALAQGFLPGNATVNVVEKGGKPVRLALTLTPPKLPPDGSIHNSTVLVQLLDDEGRPTVDMEREVKVYLSSSNPTVASIMDETVTIRKGEPYIQAGLRTGVKAGETVIAASAQDLEPDTATLETEGFTPSLLKVYVAPPAILANNRTKNVVSIQVQDGEGNPTVSIRDLTVYITSSSTSIGLYPSRFNVTIHRGENYAKTFFPATSIPGETNITVSAQGLEPATATLYLVVLPLNLTLDTPDQVRLNQTVTVSVEATSRSLPVKDVAVEWTVIGGTVQAEENRTGSDGKAYLTFKQTSGTLTLIVQASKIGYETAVVSKSIEVLTPKPETKPRPLEINILGLKIPLLTLMIIIACLVAALIGIYTYVKIKRAPARRPNLHDEDEFENLK